MSSNQKQFRLIAYLGMFLLLCALTIWYSNFYFDRAYDAQVKQMQATMESVKSISTSREVLLQWSNEFSKRLPEYRITVIDQNGTVLYDSKIQAGLLENHSNREEFILAQQGGFGIVERDSSSTNQKTLYTALKINEQDTLRLAISLVQWRANLPSIAFETILIFCGGFLFVLLLDQVAFRWMKQIEALDRVVREWNQMKLDVRIESPKEPILKKLSSDLNRFTFQINDQLNQRSEQYARIQTVVESMQTGVLLLDDQLHILSSNQAAVNLLGYETKGGQNKLFVVDTIPHEVLKWIQKSFQSRLKLREELHVYYPEDRILDLVFLPLPMLPDSNASMLIFIQDITPLRRLEKMRSEFVANVSHELKTPIAAIRGFAETLLAGALHDDQAAESFLKVIMEESERLNRLINEILELSRMESKRTPLLFSWTSLDQVIQKSMNVLDNAAQTKRIIMEYRKSKEAYAEIDEDRIKQVLINLLSNAVNYTHDGGKVSVEIDHAIDEQKRNWILISILDNGIGMHQDEIGRIFERFYRIDKARSRSSGGTGLGLSIVKHIVELHHGKIEVESRIGRGSKFTVWLPETQYFAVPQVHETERVPS